MFTWLATLPLWAQISLPIIAMVLLVVIALYGNMAIQWGRKKIGFGRGKRGRSCKDCVLLILAKKATHNSKVEIKQDTILRDQMNFVEQKMQEIMFMFIDSYNEQQKEKDPIMDPVEKNKQITLYAEAFKNALEDIKNEIRRSFKENGFHELTASEFREYVKDKTKTLISIAKNYFINRYPHEGMAIKLSERFERIDQPKIEDIVEEVFIKAKEIRINTDNEITALNEKFAEEMDNFIGEGNA